MKESSSVVRTEEDLLDIQLRRGSHHWHASVGRGLGSPSHRWAHVRRLSGDMHREKSESTV